MPSIVQNWVVLLIQEFKKCAVSQTWKIERCHRLVCFYKTSLASHLCLNFSWRRIKFIDFCVTNSKTTGEVEARLSSTWNFPFFKSRSLVSPINLKCHYKFSSKFLTLLTLLCIFRLLSLPPSPSLFLSLPLSIPNI